MQLITHIVLVTATYNPFLMTGERSERVCVCEGVYDSKAVGMVAAWVEDPQMTFCLCECTL